MVRILTFIILSLVMGHLLVGCATGGEGPWERSGQRNYGAIGAGLGAGLGAVAGGAVGGKGGALLGAATGAVVGGLVGSGIGGAMNAGEDPKLLCRWDQAKNMWVERDDAPCMFDVSRGEVPPMPNGQGGWVGGSFGGFSFGPQPGRGYYSTEDCSNWRQHGLEEACRRQQARDGSNQRQGAFDLGRSGANCRGFGVADLRESCEFGRRVTREREAERIFNLTR